MGRKQLEESLLQREKEIAELNARVAEQNVKLKELGTKVEEYQRRESAIVSALMEAKAAAERILTESKQRAETVVAEAERIKEGAEVMARNTAANAEAESRRTVDLAKVEAGQIKTEAEASVIEARRTVERLRSEIRELADGAKAQAERFAEYLSGTGSGIPLAREPAANKREELEQTAAADKERAATLDLPDEYSGPSELMKNIYAIQGRELPESGTPAKQMPAQEPPQPEEASAQHDFDPDEFMQAHAAKEASDVDKLMNELMGIVAQEPAAEPEQSAAELAPEPEPCPAEASDEPKGTEGHVWTVDEIVNSVLNDIDKKESAVDMDLDALINDVFKN